MASSPIIDVESAGTFDVTGLTNGSFVVAPGQTIEGTGTIIGQIVYGSGTSFDVTLTAGSGSSNPQSTLTASGATIDGANLDITLNGTPDNGASFDILDNTSSNPIDVESPFLVDGVPVAEGGSFVVGSTRFVLTYAGGPSGNDVVLTVQNTVATTTTVTLGSEFVNGSVTYNGAAHGAAASWASNGSDGGGGPLTVTYVGIDGTSYAASTTAPTNVGVYDASASFTGDASHDRSSASQSFTITQAMSSVAVTGGSFIYDGTTHAGGSAVVSGAGVVTGSRSYRRANEHRSRRQRWPLLSSWRQRRRPMS